MKIISFVVKDPLAHFFLGGCVLFLIFNAISPSNGSIDPKIIIVDREAILVHIQNTSKIFDPALVATKFDDMNRKERENLVNDYIREEVMFREASSLGLDKEDYVMRRRVIQKLYFITDDIIERSLKVNDATLSQYFKENKDNYYVESFITLTHVFFNAEKHGSDDLLELAAEKKNELNDKQVIFSNSIKHGDRFHYNVNYVERTYDLIQSHFGDEMAREVFSLTPSDQHWYGPFKSHYGYHLVMISRKQEGRYSMFEEVRRQVEIDFLREEKHRRKEQSIAKIIEGYDIKNKL